jgi:NAD(P)-dependent dehydrogenase (short-subunit alcohol dehydrogenase family)
MPHSERTAIVTGAGKRVGAAIATTLAGAGWTVLAHVRRPGDPVPDGTLAVAADLSEPDCAERIFAAAAELPPVRLLVNNAARFALDGFGDFKPDELDAHMLVNLRAPILLTEKLAASHRPGSGEAAIVNILDAKLAAPNPDYLSYTLSKQALAGFTELAARALAPAGIRVNAIAPALMLRSPGQSEANFRAMHRRNPLGRGVEPADVAAAVLFLANSPTLTGEVITLDSGQRHDPPRRDVQFLEEQ